MPHAVRPEGLPVVRPLLVPRFNTVPAKRLLDLLVSATLLIFFAPLFLLVAMAVALDSPGPVFYHQIRVGQNRRSIERRRDRIQVTDDKRRGDRRRILSEGRLFVRYGGGEPVRLRSQGGGVFAQDKRLSRLHFRAEGDRITGFVVARYGSLLDRATRD